MVVWGREAGRCGNVVCVGPVASRPAIYGFGVRLKAWAVVAGLGRAFGSVRLTGRLAARLCCVCAGTGSAVDGLANATLPFEASVAVVGT